ncbi:MAG: hypothetical protein DSY97_08245 [SAR324 cluster bacterium]|uniref:Uncharacterized protein n=1 Tax=SAR324 cluster bacterium TaxID=2024889 RepID=A0A432G4D0_9DELT|nr:MAG: hypothetical protein DSY97_08245 [SAR324 cluster bacterium]
MLSRKPKKISLLDELGVKRSSSVRSKNSSDSPSVSIRKEGLSLLSPKPKRKKSAADAATSILDELGVKRSSSVRSKKISPVGIQKKAEQKKETTEELESWERIILKNHEIQIPHTKTKILNKSTTKKTEQKKFEKIYSSAQKTAELPEVKFGFHEKFVLLSMLVVMGVASLAIIGGHLKLLDSAIFYQLVGGNVHQLEFAGEFQARLVENGYNRLPVFVVEGSIRNTFNESDQIKKIQLKAFAFDADQQLIANHFTYAGTVLSDEQLESLSPMDIKALRHSSEFGIQDSTALTNDKNDLLNTSLPQAPLIPFQVVFIKSVPTIKKTSLQIVSYVRNNKIVYVHAPNL